MMRDVWLLTKLYIVELLGWNRALHAPRGRARAGKIATIAAIDAALVVLLGYAGVYLFFLMRALSTLGLADLFPSLIATSTAMLTFFGALLRTSGTLYGCRDHDLQAALPISRRALALSRVLRLYVTDGIIAMFFLLPGTVVWIVTAHPTILQAFLAVLLMPVLPLAPMALGAGAALLLSGVLRRFGGRSAGKTIALVILAVALLALFYYGAWRFGVADEQGGAEAVYALMVGMLAPVRALSRFDLLASWYGSALNGGSIPAALGVLALSVGFVAVLIALYAPRMDLFQRRILSSRRGGASFRNGRSDGVLRALWRKEMRRYFSSPVTVLNTGIGNAILIVATVALALRGNVLIALIKDEIPFDISRSIAPAIALFFAFCVCMGNYCAASISLEGRSVWISKTLPVPGGLQLVSKALVPVCISIPSILVGTAVAAPVLSISMPQAALIFLFPTGTLAFCAAFGVWLNLRSYRFDWTSETDVVKQSLPVGLSLLAPLAVLGGGAALFALGWSLWWLTAVIIAASILFWIYVYRIADKAIFCLKY